MHCIRYNSHNQSNFIKSFIYHSLGISSIQKVSSIAASSGDKSTQELDRSLNRKSYLGNRRKKTKLLAKREPFLKNIFLGKFDTQLLTYPEVLDKEKFDFIEKITIPIQNFFKNVNSQQIDIEKEIDSKTKEDIKELGLYGLQVPEEYGGLELNASEYSRIMEIISLDGSIASMLIAHQALGIKSILLAGSEVQKAKYLPLLASGEWTAALCLSEKLSGSDLATIETTARLSSDESHYVLNGHKTWVTNGSSANLFVVYARIDPPTRHETAITAFLVERSSGGIHSSKNLDTMGNQGTEFTEIEFKNTPVPVENILGENGHGFKLAMDILHSGRFSMGSAGAGILKNLMEITVDYANRRTQFHLPLSSYGIIKAKLAQMEIDVYAMESLTYFVAGLLDKYDDQDCAIEQAAVKVFSSERVWTHASECLQIFGAEGYKKDNKFERVMRDWRSNFISQGTNEILRLFIGLSGLQHSAQVKESKILEFRNPFEHPKTMASSFMRKVFNSENVALDLYLWEYVHPSLRLPIDTLEGCVKKMEIAVEQAFIQEGAKIMQPENQMMVSWLADMATDILSMTAVISRASRSYCLGVHNSDHEIDMAVYFVYSTSERFQSTFMKFKDGQIKSEIIAINKIADNVINKKGYGAMHPFVRTFW